MNSKIVIVFLLMCLLAVSLAAPKKDKNKDKRKDKDCDPEIKGKLNGKSNGNCTPLKANKKSSESDSSESSESSESDEPSEENFITEPPVPETTREPEIETTEPEPIDNPTTEGSPIEEPTTDGGPIDEPTTDGGPIDETSGPPFDFSCAGLPDGLYPNVANCKTFFSCSNEQAYLFNCPSGLNFDKDSLTCLVPDEATCATI